MNKLVLCSQILLLNCFLTMSTVLAQVPPPPGDGIYPAAVTRGDVGPAPAVPTESINNASSSIFATMPEQIPMIVNVRTATHSNNTHQYMGKRIVFSIRMNTLNPMQQDLISSILSLSSITGQQNVTIDVNQDQLAQIEKVLDAHTSIGQKPNQFKLFNYLPTVRKFGRWAVLLGVVYATVMLAIAAYGIVMSHRSSADKVISTMAGLIVLLMAYTIYCLVINNASQSSISTTISDTP